MRTHISIGMDNRAATSRVEPVPVSAAEVRVAMPAAARDRIGMRTRARCHSPKSSSTRRSTRGSRRRGKMFFSRRATYRARSLGLETRAPALRRRPRRVSRRHIPPQVIIVK